MKLGFAIDRGGTFTDVFVHRPSRSGFVLKVLSEDPQNYPDAPTEGVRRVLEQKLLLELSDFASKGCPDLIGAKRTTELIKKEASIRRSVSSLSDVQDTSIAERQQARQRELINQLREQLQDLEKFAYETGGDELPSSELMEKQRVIIDSLQNQLDLHVDDKLHALTNEDLQRHVDQAVKKLINPLKIKDQLVDQLKTQIDDLHRFVEFQLINPLKIKDQLVDQLKTQIDDLHRFVEFQLINPLKIKDQLVDQLKTQIDDLHRFVEFQLINPLKIKDQLVDQLKTQIDDLHRFVEFQLINPLKIKNQLVDQLKTQIDDLHRFVGFQLINPLKIKDQLVDQLKTQIDDLHRFVEFLQTAENQNCTCLEIAVCFYNITRDYLGKLVRELSIFVAYQNSRCDLLTQVCLDKMGLVHLTGFKDTETWKRPDLYTDKLPQPHRAGSAFDSDDVAHIQQKL